MVIVKSTGLWQPYVYKNDFPTTPTCPDQSKTSALYLYKYTFISIFMYIYVYLHNDNDNVAQIRSHTTNIF